MFLLVSLSQLSFSPNKHHVIFFCRSEISRRFFSLSLSSSLEFFSFFLLFSACYDELSSISSPTSACTRGLTKKVFLAIVTRHFIYLIIEIFCGISSRLVRKKHNFFFHSSVLGTTTCAGVHSLPLSW